MVNFNVGDSCDKFVGRSAVDRMSIVCHFSLFKLTKEFKVLGLKVYDSEAGALSKIPTNFPSKPITDLPNYNLPVTAPKLIIQPSSVNYPFFLFIHMNTEYSNDVKNL